MLTYLLTYTFRICPPVLFFLNVAHHQLSDKLYSSWPASHATTGQPQTLLPN